MSKFLTFLFATLLPALLFAQAPDFSVQDTNKTVVPAKPQIIITNDGGTFTGMIESMNDREVTIVTKDKGRVIIPKYAIKKMEPVTQQNYRSGEFISENCFPEKYILGNSGLPMVKRAWDISSLYYFAWSANYSFSEHFSLGMSTVYYFPLTLNIKSSFKIGNEAYFSPELHAGYLWFSEGAYFGHFNLKLCSGTRQNNFTVGVGMAGVMQRDYGYYNNSVSYYQEHLYTVNAGGVTRISNGLAFTGEFWALVGPDFMDDPIFAGAAGFKTIKSEKHSFTFGLFALAIQGGLWGYNRSYGMIPVPVITYQLKL